MDEKSSTEQLLKKTDKELASSKVQFSRLTLDDIPEISKFMMSIWPKLYGELGHPLFCEGYLHWLFGGPNREKHFLIGARKKNTLVAFHSFLYRTIAYGKKRLDAYLHTHATISPHMEPSLRMHCAVKMTKQHLLFSEESQFCDAYCDVVYSFQDVKNPVKAFGERVLKKHFNVQLLIFSAFNQFILIPAKLKTYLSNRQPLSASVVTSQMTEQDFHAITKLFNNVAGESIFSMQMTEHELKHYFFSHPDHRTYVVNDCGTFKALIHFYPVEIVKEKKISTYVIIEFLITDVNKMEHAACLLQEAVAYSEKVGSKGVVFENATYLDYSKYLPLGLMPTLRKMDMSVISRDEFPNISGVFRCDVK